MKIFHCDHCQSLVFFENTQCVKCGHTLAFLSDQMDVASLDKKGDNLWVPASKVLVETCYRLCRNYSQENVCNWAVPSDDPNPYCLSCRLTRVIPPLDRPGSREHWQRLEMAKRRLVCHLLALHLPLATKTDDPKGGLAFEFLADPPAQASGPSTPVLTGHAEGVIVINVAEADDSEREKRRQQLHEPYRTLLGHFRHEIGHYYWDRLIAGSDMLEEFRLLFGDERQDYASALKTHYQTGPPLNWQDRFISAYAASHPWEDWAESWAHFLHMTDTLETAMACGLSMKPRRPNEPTLKSIPELAEGAIDSFDQMIGAWYSVTYILNNLNRAIGFPDGYPFVLYAPVVEKLRFIQTVIARRAPRQPAVVLQPLC